jgi:hypothetical protein
MLIVQALVFSPLVKPESTRWLFTPSIVILGLGLAAVPLATTRILMAIAVAAVAASAGILSPIATYWIEIYGAHRDQTQRLLHLRLKEN